MPEIKERLRRERVEERRAQILAAAARVFARKGYERATIANIAREAGLAEGSIYNYFKNKADLLVSIPRQFVGPTVDSLRRDLLPPSPEGSPAPDAMLTHLARSMIRTLRENADIVRILLTTLPTMNQAARQHYMESTVTFATSMLEAYLRELISRGVLRADLDPSIAAFSFAGMFFPFVMLGDILKVRSPTDFDYEEVIAQAVQTFLRGALAPRRGAR